MLGPNVRAQLILDPYRSRLTRPLGRVLAGTRFACEAAELTCSRAGALPPRRSDFSPIP